jgi:hypothetical protein
VGVGVDVVQTRCVGVLVCWCVGVLVCWCVGVLVCWCVGVLVCWCVGVLVCWCVFMLEVLDWGGLVCVFLPPLIRLKLALSVSCRHVNITR